MHDVIVFTHSGGSLIRVTQLLMLFGMLSITIAIRGYYKQSSMGPTCHSR